MWKIVLPRHSSSGFFAADEERQRSRPGPGHATRDRRVQHGDAAFAQALANVACDRGRDRAHVHEDHAGQVTLNNPVRSERDRLDVATGGNHGEHHLALARHLGGRRERGQAEAAGVGARTLAARVSDKRMAGSEQMPRHLAAHVTEADKSESHGFHLQLMEKVNLTLLRGNA
jgi:hypothetical protein